MPSVHSQSRAAHQTRFQLGIYSTVRSSVVQSRSTLHLKDPATLQQLLLGTIRRSSRTRIGTTFFLPHCNKLTTATFDSPASKFPIRLNTEGCLILREMLGGPHSVSVWGLIELTPVSQGYDAAERNSTGDQRTQQAHTSGASERLGHRSRESERDKLQVSAADARFVVSNVH